MFLRQAPGFYKFSRGVSHGPNMEEGGEAIHGARQVRGEATPLLHQNNSSRHHEGAASLEDDGQLCLQHRSGDWRALAILLGFECLESIAFYGVSANLVLYFTLVFHESNAASAMNVATWTGTCLFTPLILAIAADTCLGRYWTVLISTLVYLLGMITVTLSASLPFLRPLPCQANMCPSATTAQNMVLLCGLYLVALGSGGKKSSLLPLGADQFHDENPVDRGRKASFISLFYLSFVIGNLVATTLLVWIQENISWALGYSLATLCLTLALGKLLLGTPIFRLVSPGGSPLKSVAQVLVASFRKMHLDVPADPSLLYEVDDKAVEGLERLEHTESFQFLDKAATISGSDMRNGYSPSNWRLCTVTQVEELKILLRLLPIWLSCIMYSTAYSHVSTTFIEQGNAMNTRIGSFSIPPASLPAFGVLCVICLTLIFNRLLIPMARSYTGNGRGLSLLQRLGVGRMLMIITMAVAAIMETKRLKSASVGQILSIAWQLPQYFILACSHLFCIIGQLEFFYEQAPNSMKSMCNSFYLLSISLGNYLSLLIISCITFFTTKGGRPGWLPDNLNEGHLDYFFWCMSALSAVDCLGYLVCAKKYTLKKVVLEENIHF